MKLRKNTQILRAMHTPKAISGAGGIDLHTVFSNKFHPKEGRRPYMDSFASAVGCKAQPSMPAGFRAPLSHSAWVVSAQAVGKRMAKLERRKDTNLLLRYSAPLSGITSCCFVRTDNPWHT